MRFTQILALATVAVFASATATSAAPSTPNMAPLSAVVAPAPLLITAVQEPAQPPQTEIKVQIDDEPNVVWYTDPVWLAVGAIALLVVIVLAVMAARGGDRGGTTVVR